MGKFMDEMKRSEYRKEYCEYVRRQSSEQLEALKKKREELDSKMEEIKRRKEAEEEDAKRVQQEREEISMEQQQQWEDNALRIMREADEIELGKNIGMQSDKKTQAATRGKKLGPSGEHLTGGRKAITDGQPKRLTKAERKRARKEGRGGESSEDASQDPDAPSGTLPSEQPTQELPSAELSEQPPRTESLPSGGDHTVEPLVPEEQAKELL